MMAVSLFAATGSASAAGTIEGKAVDATTKVGIEGISVCVYDSIELELAAPCVNTDSNGEYATAALISGNYIVRFWGDETGYVSQFFDGAMAYEDATEVPVSNGPTTGIDAEMEIGGEITGRVTDATTGAGIDEVEVCAFNFSVFAGCTETGASGGYTLQGVASGSYTVEFWAAFLGYETRFYNESASSSGASPVPVTAPGTTPGIDARLSKPGSKVIVTPVPKITAPVLPIRKVVPKPKPKKPLTCRKGFKKVKRHGRKVCVKKHKKKKHRS
ncbi:MAG TPA: carboxypeptidase-like regulatory domain-containing protein [Solirubrobacterales bacterium]|nr:carboxypeptidase-like regulatory domain-containing protein [Solirubrobacterales bacterium]